MISAEQAILSASSVSSLSEPQQPDMGPSQNAASSSNQVIAASPPVIFGGPMGTGVAGPSMVSVPTSSGYSGGKPWTNKPGIPMRRWKTYNKPRRIHETKHREIPPPQMRHNLNTRKFLLQDIVWRKAEEIFGGNEQQTLQGLLETLACRLNERSFVQLNFESCRSVKMLQKWMAEDFEEKERN